MRDRPEFFDSSLKYRKSCRDETVSSGGSEARGGQLSLTFLLSLDAMVCAVAPVLVRC